VEVGGQPPTHRHREPRLRRAPVRVPHRLPRLLVGPAALDPVPAQLRRLRLRPGDLRAGPGARRARGGDPDPDALLPRGVERRPGHEHPLRPDDPRRARALHGRSAPRPLAAAAPHRGDLGAQRR
jgi:hypothetical protein